MPGSPNGRIDSVEHPLPECPSAQFVTRCGCGRVWKLTMERGQSGSPGCMRCSCEAELVSWSGTVVFNAVPAETD